MAGCWGSETRTNHCSVGSSFWIDLGLVFCRELDGWVMGVSGGGRARTKMCYE